ncbi:MAG TPA: hypothetical protein VFF71_05330 [Luteimonas sp.]|nr:hypothetical protein [Luteimonas sp.]
MSAIHPEDFTRFFEETCGVRFVDAATGKPALEVIQQEGLSKSEGKSDYDLWLEEQDEATRLEHKMGAL